MRKHEISARAARVLPKLQPGETVHFDLPPGQPGRRILYQAVNAAAYRAFGVGNYQLKSDGGISVTRLTARPGGAA